VIHAVALSAVLLLVGPGAAVMDDGRYINRLSLSGALDLGAGWQHDPGYLGVDDPAPLLRATPRGALWWQTRDLDFGIVGSLDPRLYLGDVAPILLHRPDALVDMSLDARGGERVGVDMQGRVHMDSAQRFPADRPDAFEPWMVPLWGEDLREGLAPTSVDLRPVVSLWPEPSSAIELGGTLELDQLRWLEPPRTPFGREPELRLAAGPVLGTRFLLTPDLALQARGQVQRIAWSRAGGSQEGWGWCAWAGMDGRVAPTLWLRVMAGYGGGVVEASDLDIVLEPGLLATAELELGREGPRQLAVGYRRGPLDVHSYTLPEVPHHYGYLRLGQAGSEPLQASLEAAYRHRSDLVNELPRAAALARLELELSVLDWMGLGAAGFFEQALVVEDGWPWPEQRFYGGYGVIRLGRVEPPSWRRPG
jgi:hypothetical protein